MAQHVEALQTRIAELEEALRRARDNDQRVAALLHLAKIGSWELDVDTGRSLWSPETRQILGVGPTAPAVPGTVLSVTHPDDRHIVRDALLRVRDGNRAYDITYRILWPDGSERVIHSRADVVLDEAGRPIRLAGLVQDITEQERLRAQLVRSQKLELVGRLSAGLAHDLNNMLTIIQGSASFLQDASLDETGRADVALILDAAQQSASLTAGLLAFGRNQVFRPRLVEMASVIAGVQPMIERVSPTGVDVTVDVRSPRCTVRADPQQLGQVLVNLALNAFHAMPDGGMLRIALDRSPACDANSEDASSATVCLIVSDTGTGMSEETLSRAFEPFFTTKLAHQGSGLGLSTVLDIVKQTGGTIQATSEVGKGTTFELRLPYEVGDLGTSAGSRSEALEGGRERVLLVDDDDAVRHTLARALRQAGYQVFEADGGEQAWAQYGRGTDVDLLVTDVMMPSWSGRAVADFFSAGNPSLRVLYVSGYAGDPRLGEHGPRDGDAFLAKPFTPQQFVARVREVLEA